MAESASADATAGYARVPGGVAEVAALAYPVVLATIAETVMQVVNSAMVGRLGATELGAVGFGGIWMWTLLCLFVGAAQGVQVFVARAFGAGERTSCGRWVWQGVYLLLPSILVWCALIYSIFPMAIQAIGVSPELEELAVQYAYSRIPQGPAIVVSFSIVSFFRGIGDTRTPLVGSLVSIGCNVVLAYGLIYGEFGLPAWGVVGAGAAMTFASWINATVMLCFFLRRKMRETYHTAPARADRASIRRYLVTSTPIGGQWMLEMVSFALFSSVVARMGDAEMAATQAMLQLLSLSFMQAVAISIAAGTLIGQYIGADEIASAERSYRSGLKLAAILASGIAVVFVSFPEWLMGIFSEDRAVLALGRPLLALGAAFQLMDAIGIVTGGSLRGAGDTRWSFVISAVAAWLVRLPLLWIAVVWLDTGLYGAWIAETFFIASLCGAFVLRFRSGHWKKLEI